MKCFIMATASTILLLSSAIAQEQASGAGGHNPWVRVAMGPVSAPQKRSALDYPKEPPSTCPQFNDACPKSWGGSGAKSKTSRY